MAITNLTNLSSAANIGAFELFKYASNTTHGLLAMSISSGLFLIMLASFVQVGKYDFQESLAVSSLLSFGFSIFLVSEGLLNFVFMFVYGILLAISAFFLYIEKRNKP